MNEHTLRDRYYRKMYGQLEKYYGDAGERSDLFDNVVAPSQSRIDEFFIALITLRKYVNPVSPRRISSPEILGNAEEIVSRVSALYIMPD